ncbi:MAG TPA: potassium transporter Kup [Caulobacteraceae bacterium]|nr:potassium transporter Kup [Caulobacteraceae bacterium]
MRHSEISSLGDTAPAPTQARDGPRLTGRRRSHAALILGSLGVVFGDIGTSPLYALREALAHSRPFGSPQIAVLGVVSLILWTLTLIVTVKYVTVLMRADNKGEGGPVALMALAQRVAQRRTRGVFVIGIIGVALFFGDGVITPAFSVLSAVEGLGVAPHVGHLFTPLVLPIAGTILVALFLVQARGTHLVAALFGPVMALWFATLAALGVYNLIDDPKVLLALNPYFAIRFLAENGFVGFVVLGSVFLAVTGAEALYADMGQFGRRPVRAAWLWVVWPCLALNYLGQGAIVLRHPAARHSPLFEMTPHFAYWPVLILATSAAVIASQAVLTGAYSMTQQAVQIGLLPRITIRRTSETQTGQIFVPAANGLMLAGVLVLLVVFQTSHRLASAYGVAVTGTMFISTFLAYGVARRMWKWSWAQVLVLFVPITVIDTVFLTSNLVKLPDGAWIPLVFGVGLVLVMETWAKGVAILTKKTLADSVSLSDVIEMLAARPPWRNPGVAIFPTSTPDLAPVALLHNLKHNQVLHEKNVILTLRTAETPRVPEADRVLIEPINADFTRVTLNYGFMEQPNVPRALNQCKKLGLKFDIMNTSFFLGRRKVVADAQSGMPMWQDALFIFLMRNSANPTEFFHLPPGRVIELGAQVTV